MSIHEFLLSRRVPHEYLLHAPSAAASRFARSVHTPGRLVAKGVLIRAGGRFVLAVLPSTARVDLARLSALLGETPVALVSEDEVEVVFGDCERGALPPFGRLYGLQTFVDASLASGPEVVCIGNQRHEGIRLRYGDYEAVESPTVGRFAAAIDSGGGDAGRRRAG